MEVEAVAWWEGRQGERERESDREREKGDGKRQGSRERQRILKLQHA